MSEARCERCGNLLDERGLCWEPHGHLLPDHVSTVIEMTNPNPVAPTPVEPCYGEAGFCYIHMRFVRICRKEGLETRSPFDKLHDPVGPGPAPKTDTPATEIPVKLFMVEGDYHLWDDAEGVYWVRERELNQLKLALSRAESTLAAERASRLQAETQAFNAGILKGWNDAVSAAIAIATTTGPFTTIRELRRLSKPSVSPEQAEEK